MTDSRLTRITQRIIDRSRDSRAQYLEKIASMRDQGPQRGTLSCTVTVQITLVSPQLASTDPAGCLEKCR